MISPSDEFIKETQRFYSLLGPNSPNKILIDKYNSNKKTITNSANQVFKKIRKNNHILNLLSNENNATTLIITNNILKEIKKSKNRLGQDEIDMIINRIRETSLKIIKENSKRVNVKNGNLIYDIVKTNLTYNLREDEKEDIYNIIIHLIKESKLYNEIDVKRLQILKLKSIKKSEISKKLIFRNTPSFIEMPNEILNPRIILTNLDLGTDDIDKIIKAKANVVINKKPIDVKIARQLSKNNILAFENEKDLDLISKAMYKSIIISSKFIKEENVTSIKEIVVGKKNSKSYVEISGLPNETISTIILKSEELNKLKLLRIALLDTIEKVNLLLKSKKIVKGSGFIERKIGEKSILGRAFLVVPKLIGKEKQRVIEPDLVKIKNIEIICENLQTILSSDELITI